MIISYENESGDLQFKNILNMPNQIIMIDKTNISNLKHSSIDFMLHKAQVEIFNKSLTFDVARDTWFELDMKGLKDFSLMKKDETNYKYIWDNIEDSQKWRLEYYDDGKFTSMVLVPNIELVNEGEYFKFRYKLNSDLIRVLVNRGGVIGSETNTKGHFTPIYLDLMKDNNFKNKQEQAMYKVLLLINSQLIHYKMSNCVEFPIEEFKKIVGISNYKTGISLENEIGQVFNKVLPTTNLTSKYSLIYGYRNKITGIKFKRVYLDFQKEDLLYINYNNKIEEYEDSRYSKENRELLEDIQAEHNIFYSKVCEMGYTKQIIDKIVKNTNYELYIKAMNKLKLIPVDENLFNLGYRYAVILNEPIKEEITKNPFER